jgi:hypothetical protein
VPALSLGVAVALLIAFGVALLSKVRSRTALDDFEFSLSQYGLRGRLGQRVVARLVITLEAVAVIALLALPAHPVPRFAPAVLLLIGFSVAIGSSAGGRSVVECHCFGSSTALPVRLHVGLNLSLAAAGLIAMTGPAGLAAAGSDRVLGTGLGIIAGALFVCASFLYEALSTADERAEGTVA